MSRLIQREDLAERCEVFVDRADAGRVLAALLREARVEADLLLAIPAGGVPVAQPMVDELGWAFDVAVVSKITLPWNTEAGYGAVAFDGSVLLNEPMIRECNLTPRQVEDGIARTRRKVERRVQRLRRGREPLNIDGKRVVVVDDGLASGFTMRATLRALRNKGAATVVVAVPTGHAGAMERIGPLSECIVCANVRGRTPFAVADAYEHWQDVPEALAELALQRIWEHYPRAARR